MNKTEKQIDNHAISFTLLKLHKIYPEVKKFLECKSNSLPIKRTIMGTHPEIVYSVIDFYTSQKWSPELDKWLNGVVTKEDKSNRIVIEALNRFFNQG